MFVVRSQVMWKHWDKFTFVSSKNVSCEFSIFIYFRNASWNSQNRLGIPSYIQLSTEHSPYLFFRFGDSHPLSSTFFDFAIFIFLYRFSRPFFILSSFIERRIDHGARYSQLAIHFSLQTLFIFVLIKGHSHIKNWINEWKGKKNCS